MTAQWGNFMMPTPYFVERCIQIVKACALPSPPPPPAISMPSSVSSPPPPPPLKGQEFPLTQKSPQHTHANIPFCCSGIMLALMSWSWRAAIIARYSCTHHLVNLMDNQRPKRLMLLTTHLPNSMVVYVTQIGSARQHCNSFHRQLHKHYPLFALICVWKAVLSSTQAIMLLWCVQQVSKC